MPWGDGTGPWWIQGTGVYWPCLRFGRFWRFGRGAFGRGFWRWNLLNQQAPATPVFPAITPTTEITKEEEKSLLKEELKNIQEEIKILQEETKEIKKRLKELGES